MIEAFLFRFGNVKLKNSQKTDKSSNEDLLSLGARKNVLNLNQEVLKASTAFEKFIPFVRTRIPCRYIIRMAFQSSIA